MSSENTNIIFIVGFIALMVLLLVLSVIVWNYKKNIGGRSDFVESARMAIKSVFWTTNLQNNPSKEFLEQSSSKGTLIAISKTVCADTSWWEKCASHEDGDTYYYNSRRKQVQWERPTSYASDDDTLESISGPKRIKQQKNIVQRGDKSSYSDANNNATKPTKNTTTTRNTTTDSSPNTSNAFPTNSKKNATIKIPKKSDNVYV